MMCEICGSREAIVQVFRVWKDSGNIDAIEVCDSDFEDDPDGMWKMFSTREGAEAYPTSSISRRRILVNRLDGIISARRDVAEGLAEISRLLSHLPNTVPDLSKDSPIEWHENLVSIQHIVDTGKASWGVAEHHLTNTINRIFKEVLDE